ncbi:MAG: DAK2 domain-containing protein [Anaerolineales bacterium]|nr:DAK2 domain-containing protein [Anaerolineales bacterium]
MEQPYDLGSLFNAALETMVANQHKVDELDGYNGNHGANMVDNLRLLAETAQGSADERPADTLRRASAVMQERGHGGTSQFYARGLAQAAEEVGDMPTLDAKGVASILQTVLSAVPSQGYPESGQPSESVLQQLVGLASSAGQQQQYQQADQGGGDLLGALLGGLGGGGMQQQPQVDQGGGGGLLSALLPAGLAFLQAQQSGASTGGAATQALLSVLLGQQANPFQSGNPRTAAGGLLLKAILKALGK